MASTGKKGKKNKGKTLTLNDFLSNSRSWGDQVDEADKLGEFNRKLALPAAPRAALEFDENKIPRSPPYVAYVSNLSYELQDGDISSAFEGLDVINVRLPRDERTGRLKGFGYVEFGDRESFIEALLKYEATIRGRRIKIDVAESEGDRRRGGQRGLRDRDSNYDSERTLGDWRSGPKRSDFSGSDDRRGPMTGRKDYGGFKDRDGYDKGRGGESSWRDGERRYGNDRESRSYGSRRHYNEPDMPAEPKTRTKLNLEPRTIPVVEIVVKEEPSSEKNEDQKKAAAARIFGQAKPVDTAAREREIEQRLEKEKEGVKSEKESDKAKPKNSDDDSSSEVKQLAPESKESVWVRRSQRLDTQNVTSRDSSRGQTNDSEEPEKEPEKKTQSTDESSRFGTNRKNDDYDSDRDNDSRYGRYNKTENRYNDWNRESDKSFGRDDRWKDDRDRRERDRRDPDRRDRVYDYDRRSGNSGGRPRDKDGDYRRFDRDGDSKRYNDREGDSKRYNDREGDSKRYNDREGDSKRYNDREGDSKRYNDREGDSKRYNDREGDSKRYNDREGDSKRYNDRDGDSKRYNDRDGDSKRYNDRDGDYKRYNERESDWRDSSKKDGDLKRGQDRDSGRYKDQEDHGANKGQRGDKRGGPASGDKGSRPVKNTQDREKAPQNKDRPRDQKKTEDGLRLPKYKEATAPNYIGTNKYSCLNEDDISE